jgi:exodeoxyribonuclease X
MKIAEATFAVLDVETTGVDRATDRVVEVACALVVAGHEIETFSSLVNPQRRIPASATAIHHITNDDVRHAPSLNTLQQHLVNLCEGAVIVAHNARFDLAFLPFLRHRPVLCSMSLAMRVLPAADSYKNQGLRAYLGIDDGASRGSPPHRALGDVRITSQILAICLQRYVQGGGTDDVAQLVHDLAAPRRLSALPFGRHRGLPISDVPTEYLRWLHRDTQSAFIDARYTAQCELERRSLAS